MNPGVFAGLANLEVLNLDFNNLISLPAGVFDGLSSVRLLSLAFNYLRSLPAGIFSDLASLETIDMPNPWRELPVGLFEGLPALRYARMSYHPETSHRLSAFPARTFAGLSAPMVYLDFQGRQRASLEVSLRALGSGRFRAVAPSGAPLNIVLPVTITNGSVVGGATTVTIPAGAVQSAVVEVTRTAGATGAATATIGDLPSLPPWEYSSAQAVGYYSQIRDFRGHVGYRLTRSADLPITVVGTDGAPSVRLELSDRAVLENGGSTGVSAQLLHVDPAAAEIRLTVTAAAVAPATSGDFSVSSETVLTIAAGARASSGTVTITATDNDRYSGDRSVQVAAQVSGGSVAVPDPQTFTITEDEQPPAVALALSADRINEDGGAATVTAALTGTATGRPVVITVNSLAVAPAVAGDFQQSGTTLTIAAGATRSIGTVTIVAVHDRSDTPDKTVQVTAELAGVTGLTAPAARSLTIVDVDGTPTTRLVLEPDTIAENGGRSTVRAELSHPSHQASVLTVSSVAVSPTVAADFTQSGTTLRIAANATESTGTVTIAAVDDRVFRPWNKAVEVTATPTAGPAPAPELVRLTIEENDDPPPVVDALQLVLTPSKIAENGGRSVVSARLSRTLSDATTIRVTAAAGASARARATSR